MLDSDLHATSARECPARLTGNCLYPDVLIARMQAAERREVEALDEAYRYRRLWEFAAAALVRVNYKPKGPDERRMMACAHSMPGGLNLSGKTDGWLDFLPEPTPASEQLPFTEPTS